MIKIIACVILACVSMVALCSAYAAQPTLDGAHVGQRATIEPVRLAVILVSPIVTPEPQAQNEPPQQTPETSTPDWRNAGGAFTSPLKP